MTRYSIVSSDNGDESDDETLMYFEVEPQKYTTWQCSYKDEMVAKESITVHGNASYDQGRIIKHKTEPEDALLP